MAQYTPSSGDYCRPHRCPWGATPVRSMQVVSSIVASTVIPLGRYVALLGGATTSAGQIIPGAALGSAVVLGVGIASANGANPANSSATAGPSIPVWEANPQVEFRAISKGAPIGSSLIGLRRSIQWDSTLNVQYVDLTASTAADWRVVVTETLPGLTGNVDGDSGCYVAFKFLPHLTENIGSSIALTSTTPILAFFS